MAHRFFSESTPVNDQEQEVIISDSAQSENPSDSHPIENTAEIPPVVIPEENSPAETVAPAPAKADKPAKPALKSAAKRPRASKKDSADSAKQKTLSIAISQKEHRDLKVACIYADTSVTDFALSAVMDAMHFTYDCVSPSCGFQFTARTTDGQEPPAASQCPFCGGKVVRVKM